MVKYRYQQGIEDRLDAGDQTGGNRGSFLDAQGKANLSGALLQDAQCRHGQKNSWGRPGNIGAEQVGQTDESSQYIGQQDGGKGLRFFPAVEDKEKGVADAGQQRDQISGGISCREGIQKKADDTAAYERNISIIIYVKRLFQPFFME